MSYDTQGDSFPRSGEREGDGVEGQQHGRCGGGQNLGGADREPHLAVRLTQTIKTAEARIQNLSEWRKEHFCI